jgi:hypothetical protein
MIEFSSYKPLPGEDGPLGTSLPFGVTKTGKKFHHIRSGQQGCNWISGKFPIARVKVVKRIEIRQFVAENNVCKKCLDPETVARIERRAKILKSAVQDVPVD